MMISHGHMLRLQEGSGGYSPEMGQGKGPFIPLDSDNVLHRVSAQFVMPISTLADDPAGKLLSLLTHPNWFYASKSPMKMTAMAMKLMKL